MNGNEPVYPIREHYFQETMHEEEIRTVSDGLTKYELCMLMAMQGFIMSDTSYRLDAARIMELSKEQADAMCIE